MNTADREDFKQQLRVLCAGLDLPYTTEREEGLWRGLASLSLIQFGRAADYLLAQDDPPKKLRPTEIRQALRAARPHPLQFTPPAPPPTDDDKWYARANRLLQAHINERLAVDPRCYGEHSWTGGVNASAEMHENVDVLVKAKNLWALEVLELEPHERTPDKQAELWNDRMAAAERQIDYFRKQRRKAAA